MPRKKATNATDTSVLDYRHDAKRKNIPPAGLAAQGRVRETPRMQFAYDPHLPPVLRFDSTGGSDRLPELLEIARTRPLTAEETQLLAEALRHREPWLEWTGKRERKGFEVEPVALHIHERVAAQAILKVAARETVQRDLFADPQLEYREAVQFYQHNVDWANRMILGDSLQVMASLARREDLAGKVQMIYMDPPYGIKFASNFQPEIGKRDVKDKESDLTREPEMVKAYRDTWTLGVHSYLAYLRDRLILCRELLTDTGSIFVQISDENLHRVRSVMDEVFGVENFCSLISFRTTGGQASQLLGSVCDFLLWYAKDHEQVKYHQVFTEKAERGEVGRYRWLENTDTGLIREFADEDSTNLESLLKQHRLLVHDNITSQGVTADSSSPFVWSNTTFNLPKNSHWKTTTVGMVRLASANRLMAIGDTLRFKRYLEDFPVSPIDSVWEDTAISGFGRKKQYVVETNSKVIERCLLMTTHPGDLVLDPTCGSGTTAYVAEHWGRRWITIDTSRVAMALARQRLLTATFLFYKVKSGGAFIHEGPQEALINQGATMHERPTNHPGTTKPDPTLSPANGFIYKTVPHITLKSIAQNVALDAIFAKHQPILDEKLAVLNAALKTATPELRRKLAAKLLEKERREGKKAVTDADRRRWQLPKESWQEWEVPFEADEDWTPALKAALTEYRMAWRAKMDEVNAAIAANADQEELVDQPEVAKGVVRVSGPFTVEAVMPAEESLDTESPIGGEPEELETFAGAGGALINQGPITNEPLNAEAYLDKMLRLLQAGGVRFPNNKVLKFTRLEPCGGEYLHAEGEWQNGDAQTRTVAVSFGPQFGPVTAFQVENALPLAMRRGFEDLVFAGFSFDGAAQATIQDDPNPRVRCHLAHIRPDVNMGDLLKETPNSQIFTVFGSPRTELRLTKDGLFVIEMQGVDIYNPVDNTILTANADKVAAWFLDTDYDGRTFCITQAFFPDKSAWDKLARALKGRIDEDKFAVLSGTVSLPFPAGTQKRAAVKVIDPRGNEVMRVHRLDAQRGTLYADT
jgi:adenine-specific DNA-methyltransferase